MTLLIHANIARSDGIANQSRMRLSGGAGEASCMIMARLAERGPSNVVCSIRETIRLRVSKFINLTHHVKRWALLAYTGTIEPVSKAIR